MADDLAKDESKLVRIGATVVYWPLAIIYLIAGTIYDIGKVGYKSNEKALVALGVTDDFVHSMSFGFELALALGTFIVIVGLMYP